MSWRLLSDRLPPIGEPVILGWSSMPWSKTKAPGVMEHGCVRQEDADYANGWRWVDWTGDIYNPYGLQCASANSDDPTHWMPYPLPPNAK